VLFSVLLHGLVLILFVRSAFAPAVRAVPAVRSNITVALVMRPPPRAPEPVAQDIEAVPQPEVEEEPTPPTDLAQDIATARPISNNTNATDDVETEAAAAPGAAVWTPARIRAAITSEAGDLHSTLTQDWVAACILEKKEHGTRDCGEQQQEHDYLSESTRAGRAAGGAAFNGVTRGQRHALLAEGFEQKNAAIESLMAEAGEVGALATERYYLNRRNTAYLTGNLRDPVFMAMQGFRADPLSGPRLSLPGNILFRCKRQPCIYEYTGFSVEAPEAEPEEGEFRVAPVVLGGRP
jgi:hypothetical protein